MSATKGILLNKISSIGQINEIPKGGDTLKADKKVLQKTVEAYAIHIIEQAANSLKFGSDLKLVSAHLDETKMKIIAKIGRPQSNTQLKRFALAVAAVALNVFLLLGAIFSNSVRVSVMDTFLGITDRQTVEITVKKIVKVDGTSLPPSAMH